MPELQEHVSCVEHMARGDGTNQLLFLPWLRYKMMPQIILVIIGEKKQVFKLLYQILSKNGLQHEKHSFSIF